MVNGFEIRGVVLVEGDSDRRALETLALRQRLDLRAEGVVIEAMGGVTNVRAYVRRYHEMLRASMCDAAEENLVRRALERAGLDPEIVSACDADLEDELIRALGVEAVEQVIEAQGDLESFRKMQQQPAQRERTIEQQLHRFMGTKGGRKIAYAPLLVEALDLDRVPRPLDDVLAYVRPDGRPRS